MKTKKRQQRYTITEAASIVGLTPGRLRQLAQSGEIGEKFADVWVISESDIQWIKKQRS